MSPPVEERMGFTLIELLLSVSIIGALAAIVITAINPSKQFATVRNAERRREVRAILEAVQQHALDKKISLAAGIDGTWRMVGTAIVGCSITCGAAGTTQVTLYPAADAYLYQFTPTTNYGAAVQIQEYPWSPSWMKRGIIRFDLSGIPAGVSVSAARLFLREAQAYGVGTQTVVLHRVTRAWTEGGVSWSRTDGTTLWSVAGGDYHPLASASANIQWTGATKWDSWDALADVADFVGGTLANEGWIIRDSLENDSQAYWYFHARETATQGYSPYLLVDYALATEAGGTTASSCLDLSPALVDSYLPSLPADPLYGSGAKTYYAVRSGGGGRLSVRACSTELSEDIVVTR